jgi:hypothetical protein
MKTLHLIFTFCIGLLAGYILFDRQAFTNTLVQESTAEVKEKINTIDTNKLAKEVKLLRHNAFLKEQLQISNLHLSENKQQLKGEQTKLLALVSRMKSIQVGHRDSLLLDSLGAQVLVLNRSSDSLMQTVNQRVHLGDSLIAIRDSQIVICNEAYAAMKDLVKEQAQREQKLTSDLNALLKQQKRKRFQNKILAGGMLFVAGIATSLLVKGRQ